MAFYRFLALDDEDHILNTYKGVFTSLEIIGSKTVRDFSDSVKEVKSSGLSLTGFILDYNLGEWEGNVTGADVAKRLRKDYPKEPIFLISSQKGPAIKKALEEYELIFISKSQDVDTIEDSILSYLRAAKISKIKPTEDISVNFDSDLMTLTANGISIELRSKEFHFLKTLYQHLGNKLSERQLRESHKDLETVPTFRHYAKTINKNIQLLDLEILWDKDHNYSLVVDKHDSKGHIAHIKRHTEEENQYTLASLHGVHIDKKGMKLIGPKGKFQLKEDEFFILNFMLDRVGMISGPDKVFKGYETPEIVEYQSILKRVHAKLQKVSDMVIKGDPKTQSFGVFRSSKSKAA